MHIKLDRFFVCFGEGGWLEVFFLLFVLLTKFDRITV